jgi:DNA-binding transcriptional LysR family regulator
LLDFRVLDRLAATGSLSRTGEAVHLSQPSVSLRLGRLRRHFKDPLFVRTSQGMQPTPRAVELVKAAREAIEAFDGTRALSPAFEPSTSERVFRICVTDVGSIVVLPKLLNHLSLSAPHVRVEVSYPTEDLPRRLEAGEVDVAMGLTLPMQKGINQQALFEERFVCMLRRDHPRIKRRLTRNQFLDEAYVAVNSQWTGHSILEAALADQGIERHIALHVPAFLGLSQIVARTNLLAIIPLHAGQVFAETDRVKLLSAPVPLPSYRVKQYWHHRYHQEAGQRWFRELNAKLFKG